MILTGENQSTERKPGHSATLSTTDHILTDLASIPGLCDDGPATNERPDS